MIHATDKGNKFFQEIIHSLKNMMWQCGRIRIYRAHLAVERVVLGVVVGGVQHLVAHAALEAALDQSETSGGARRPMRAHLVPLLAARQHLLSGVHGLAAHRALGHLHWLERHRGSQVQKLELGILTYLQLCKIDTRIRILMWMHT